MIPELKGLMSPDLIDDQRPPMPSNCRVLVEAEIGPSESDGSEIFSFEVCTPSALEADSRPTWLKGVLLVESFDWHSVEQAILQYLMQCSGDSWDEIARKLSRQLNWEFEDYRATIS